MHTKSLVHHFHSPSAPLTAAVVSVILALVAASPAKAASGDWISPNSGIWSDTANWNSGIIADGAGSTGNLTANIISNIPVTLDSSRSLGTLNIGDTITSSNSYTLATGANVLTFDNGASDAQLNQISTSFGDTISGLLSIAGNGNLAVTNAAAGKTLTISAGISSALTSGTQNLNFNNANTVSVTGVISNGGTGGTIAVNKTGLGNLTLNAANSFNGGLFVRSGTVTGGVANSFGSNANVITIGDSTGGSANATLAGGSATYLNPITIASTNTGTAVITTASAGNTVFGGAVTLGNHNLTVLGGSSNLTLSGAMTGTGNLTLNSPAGNAVTISGAVNIAGTITNTGVGNAGAGNGNLISGVIGANVTGVIQDSSIATLALDGNNTAYTSGILIKKGQVTGLHSNNFGAATSVITLGDSSGNFSTTVAGGAGAVNLNPIMVAAGNTGTATITQAFSNSAGFGGLITLNSHDVNLTTLSSGGGSLALSGGFASTGTGGNLFLNSQSTGVITISGATGINNVGSITNQGTGTATNVISAVIKSNVTGVTQNSATSNLILSGANNYTGNTVSNAGTLIADETTTTTVINSGSALVLGGGGFQLKSGAATTRTLTLNGLTLNAGSSVVDVNNTGSSTTTLDLSGVSGTLGITHNTGGSVDFKATTGTLGTTAIIKTAQANDTTGILGAWATVNNGADFAVNNGSNVIAAYTGYAALDAQAGGSNPTVLDNTLANYGINAAGVAGSVAIGSAVTNINTLSQRFATASTIDTAPGILRVGTTGGVFISSAGAALTVGTSANSGVLTAGGNTTNTAGELILGNASANTLTVNSTVTNNGTGPVSVTKTGTGVALVNGTNTYTGGTSVNGGTLRAGVASVANTSGAFGINSAVTMGNVSGAILDLNGFNTQIGSLTGGGAGGGNVALGSATLTTGGDNTSPGAYAGSISGTGGVSKIGTGTQTLSGASTYTGATAVNAGVLNLRSNTATGTVAGGVSVTSGAALQIQNNITVGAEALALNGTGISGDGALRNISGNNVWQGTATLGSNTRINSDAGTLTFNTAANSITGATRNLTLGGAGNGVVSGTITTTSGTVTKDGTGTWTLGGANTYTGATTVSAGTLLVSGTINSSSGVAVNGGTFNYTNNTTALNRAVTVAGGDFKYNSTLAYTGALTFTSGTISGSGNLTGTALTIGTGRTLSPGNSPGTLATGAQTWLNGGNYNFQLVDATGLAGIGYDTTAITGGLNLASVTAGGFNINLWSLSAIGPDVNGNALNFSSLSNYSWTLASTTTGITGFNAADFTINTAAFNGTAGFSNTFGGTFSVSTSGNNLLLNYSAVPEPSTYVLLGLGLGSLWFLHRRRTKAV